jgi:hypothetical protein
MLKLLFLDPNKFFDRVIFISDYNLYKRSLIALAKKGKKEGCGLRGG